MRKFYSKSFKGLWPLVAFLVLVQANLKAQSVHRITNAEPGALKTFIENTANWASGDTLLLVSSGEYVINGPILITQSLTILGDSSLQNRPLVTFRGTDSGFKPRANDLTLTFQGFKLNGLTQDDQGEPQRSMLLSFGRAFESGAFDNSIIRFEDVEASGFVTGIELFYDQGRHYQSITINNVVWHDFSGWVLDPRLNATDLIEITNSTFYTIGGFLKNPYFSNPTRPTQIPQQIRINRNTIYNVGSGVAGADALIQVNDPTDGQVNLLFTNNIVSTLINPEAARPFRINPAAGTFMFNNNVFHNFESTRDAGIHNLAAVDAAQSNVTTNNNLTTAPAFADPATGNFTLSEDSPLLTAGTTGGPIGDPRWSGASTEDPEDPTEKLVTQIIVGTSDGRTRITVKGGFLKMVATVLPGDATDRSITWSIDREDLATIDQTGDLVAKASGTVVVTATANDSSGVKGTMSVSIINQANITSITVATPDGRTSLAIGETVQMTATLTPQNPDNPNVIWEVTNQDIATISADGLLTAHSPGTVTVTAYAEENRFMYGNLQVTIQTVTSLPEEMAVVPALYPNPASNLLHLNTTSVAEITIRSLTGSVVYTGTAQPKSTIDIAALEAGVYITTVKVGDKVQSIRVLKQ